MERYEVTLSIGFPTATHEDVLEFDEDEFEGMTEQEKEDYINEVAQEWADNYIEINWKEVK